jgi:transcriptional regulator with XRE-family HTH domain
MLSFLNSTGKRIRVLRTDLGMSQPDLASEMQKRGASISQPTLSRIEADETSPDGQIIAILARIFSVTTDYLLMITDNPLLPEEEAEDARRSTERTIVLDAIDTKTFSLVQRFVALFIALPVRDQGILLRMAEVMSSSDQPHIIGKEESDEDGKP